MYNNYLDLYDDYKRIFRRSAKKYEIKKLNKNFKYKIVEYEYLQNEYYGKYNMVSLDLKNVDDRVRICRFEGDKYDSLVLDLDYLLGDLIKKAYENEWNNKLWKEYKIGYYKELNILDSIIQKYPLEEMFSFIRLKCAEDVIDSYYYSHLRIYFDYNEYFDLTLSEKELNINIKKFTKLINKAIKWINDVEDELGEYFDKSLEETEDLLEEDDEEETEEENQDAVFEQKNESDEIVRWDAFLSNPEYRVQEESDTIENLIPDGTTVIKEKQFKNRYIPNDFYIPDSVTSIHFLAFSESTIKNVIIPDSVYRLDFSSFLLCTNLESVKLSDNLDVISRDTFYCCKNLKKVTLPSSLYKIGEFAFGKCLKLESITFPVTLKFILDSAFIDCRSLKKIVFQGTMQQWESVLVAPNAFSWSGTKEVQCLDGITHVYKNWF